MALLRCFSLECIQVHGNIKTLYRSLQTPSTLQSLQKTYKRLQENSKEGIYLSIKRRWEIHKASSWTSPTQLLHIHTNVHLCLDSHTWSMYSHCSSLSQSDLERLCGIILKTFPMFDRMDWIFSPLHRLRDNSNILTTRRKHKTRALPKLQSFSNNL